MLSYLAYIIFTCFKTLDIHQSLKQFLKKEFNLFFFNYMNSCYIIFQGRQIDSIQK